MDAAAVAAFRGAGGDFLGTEAGESSQHAACPKFRRGGIEHCAQLGRGQDPTVTWRNLGRGELVGGSDGILNNALALQPPIQPDEVTAHVTACFRTPRAVMRFDSPGQRGGVQIADERAGKCGGQRPQARSDRPEVWSERTRLHRLVSDVAIHRILDGATRLDGSDVTQDGIAPALPETATCPCARCQREIEYECIWIAGRDFGRTLSLLCPECQAQNDAEVKPPSARPGMPSAAAFWLGLIGPAGRCKTRCLALAAKAAILRGNRVTWTTANRLLEAAHDRNSKDKALATLAREHLAECLHAGVLVIDDLGKNEWTAAFESQFFQILDHRKNHRLPLLFSSNAHPEGFSLVLSDLNREPIIGRLMDRTTLLEIKR